MKVYLIDKSSICAFGVVSIEIYKVMNEKDRYTFDPWNNIHVQCKI